jgi:RNA polymerase sigma factor (sigma-70 family)
MASAGTQETKIREGHRMAAGRDSQQNEQALIDAILSGEQERFDELYAHYRNRVFGFALRRVGSRADADDITQEVFLQVYRSISSYQGRASLATWIFGIAHNVTCRHYRSKGGPSVPLEACDVMDEMKVTPTPERRMDAARAVDKCTETLQRNRTPEHLEIFRLFYGLGRPLRSIARSTGKPTDSVKDSLRRSRNLLMRDIPDLRSALMASGASA